MSAKVVSLFNQKGGVGKTTTTYFLADAAHQKGLKTLIIDTDPQANLSSSTTAEPLEADIAGLADVLSDQTDIEMSEVLYPTIWENVHLVPAPGHTLGTIRDVLIVLPTARENKLKKALKPLMDHYDLILIDCPPSIDMLTVNALVASHEVAIVTEAGKWSVDGIAELLKTVEAVKENYNEQLNIAGLMINLYDKSTNKSHQWHMEIDEAAKNLGLPMFNPPVPKAVRLADLTESARSLQQRKDDPIAAIYTHYLEQLMGAK